MTQVKASQITKDKWLARYITENNDKFIDYDGVFGSQCVDLVIDYWDKRWSIPKNYSIGGAANFWLLFEKIPTLYNNFVKVAIKDLLPGDVVIWGTKKCMPYGHCAVYTKVTERGLLVFQQDGSIDKNGDGLADGTAHLAVWPASANMLGGLRHKSQIKQPSPAPKPNPCLLYTSPSPRDS